LITHNLLSSDYIEAISTCEELLNDPDYYDTASKVTESEGIF